MIITKVPFRMLSSLERLALARKPLVPLFRWKYSFSTSASKLHSSTKFDKFREHGIVDDRGMLVFDTLHEMQVRSCQIYAQNDLFGTFDSMSGSFKYMSYAEFGKKVDTCRAMLKDLGIEQFGKVGSISNNRWEWAAVAAASYSLNAAIVPMYEAQLPSDWRFIINDSGCSVVICATEAIFETVRKDVLQDCPGVKASLCLNAPEGASHAFATAMASLEADNDGNLIQAPSEEDLASLIYTSGTTGQPKGVELTHLNFTSNVKSPTRTMVKDPESLVRETDRSLAFLPWAHSYGQTCELWIGMSSGACLAICRGVPMILEDLQLVKPTLLYAVPTLYKRVHDGVYNMMESASPIRKRLMQEALAIGHANAEWKAGLGPALGPFERMKLHVLDSLVLSKIRDRFGGNLRYGGVAGAACPIEVLRFMDAIGIPICEGYGLTETSPIITLNTPEQRLLGSVGRPIGGVEVFIVDEDGNSLPAGEEGEICCAGPNVMRGYHNNKEETDKVITLAPDGKSKMFHTGDLGRLDEDGWVKVTGRIKEQYKLENGKYVVPTPIEQAIEMSRFVNQVVVCGANRPYNVALIVPEWKLIRDELEFGEEVSDEELANHQSVQDLMKAEIHESCYKLKKFEVPKKWAFVAPFTAANNMLTPKMSIRRHKVMQAYEDLISHLYGDDPFQKQVADLAKEQAA
jgi:long-chain acyl-CoA synthetase